MESAATVRFEFTQADFIGFNLYHHKHSPATRAIKVRAMGLILAYGAAALIFKFLQPNFSEILWCVAAGSVLHALIFPAAFQRSLRRNVERMLSEGKNKGLLGQKEIALTPAEVRTTGSMGMTAIAWLAVERVVVDGDALYIYISAVSAIVVPRRAFAQEAEFEAFVETARKYLAEAAGRAK